MRTPAALLSLLCLLAAPAFAQPKAQWIVPGEAKVPSTACPLLRKSFTLTAAPTKASVTVVGLGHYTLRCNGVGVGGTLMNQAWSCYDKTLFSQEFDLAPYLRPGENVLAVSLGDSFWHVGKANDPGRFVKTDAMPDFAAGAPYLLHLEGFVMTPAGNTALVSDESWTTSPGPVTFCNIYAGEDFDARLDPVGWDRPGFDDRDWAHARAHAAPKANVVPLTGPGVRAFDSFDATEIKEIAPGINTWIFPQNCSATLWVSIEGPAGARVRFKPCEYKLDDGRVKFTYTWGTGKEIWCDYTLKGGGPETHENVFFYTGCQFVQVEGAVPDGHPNPGGLPVIKKLKLLHVRADCPAVGGFTSSDSVQNAAHRIIDWSIRSNMSHVPTDCPHREKNGWLEQDWHMARAMSYRYDIHGWFARLAVNLRDAQLPDGHIPTNSPNYLVGIPPHGYWNEAPEWGVSGVLVPWHLYEWYGDKEVLAQSFESMKKYVDYLGTTAKDGVIASNLGDWYDYGHGKGDGPSQWTPSQVSATAIWAIAADTVSKAAAVLGKPADESAYRKRFEQIRADFQRHFYDANSKTVKNNGSCQAAHATALCANLVPEADRPAVLKAIIDDLAQRNYQQTPGEVLHVFLVRALADAGRNDILHRVYARQDKGSYGYMVKTGLTTLPESWDAKPGTGNSMNHLMLGHLMEWHFAYVAGIRQAPGSVGWKSVLIAPAPPPGGPEFKSFNKVSAGFRSPAGLIDSEWEIVGGEFVLTASVPPGVAARAIMPDGSAHELRPGPQTFRCPSR